jgi:hypothetical protein
MKVSQCLFIAVCAATLAQAVAEDAVIFSGEDRFRKNWTTSTWGGLEVREGEGENGGAAVVTLLTEKTAPWSGLNLHLAFDQSRDGGAIPLDDTLKEGGILVLKLNAGKGPDGQPGGGQALQVSLNLLVDGKAVPVKALPLARFGLPVVDTDSSSWEEVRIPLAVLLKTMPDPAAVQGLLGVGVQYVDKPSCEIAIGDCRVAKE